MTAFVIGRHNTGSVTEKAHALTATRDTSGCNLLKRCPGAAAAGGLIPGEAVPPRLLRLIASAEPIRYAVWLARVSVDSRHRQWDLYATVSARAMA